MASSSNQTELFAASAERKATNKVTDNPHLSSSETSTSFESSHHFLDVLGPGVVRSGAVAGRHGNTPSTEDPFARREDLRRDFRSGNNSNDDGQPPRFHLPSSRSGEGSSVGDFHQDLDPFDRAFDSGRRPETAGRVRINRDEGRSGNLMGAGHFRSPRPSSGAAPRFDAFGPVSNIPGRPNFDELPPPGQLPGASNR